MNYFTNVPVEISSLISDFSIGPQDHFKQQFDVVAKAAGQVGLAKYGMRQLSPYLDYLVLLGWLVGYTTQHQTEPHCEGKICLTWNPIVDKSLEPFTVIFVRMDANTERFVYTTPTESQSWMTMRTIRNWEHGAELESTLRFDYETEQIDVVHPAMETFIRDLYRNVQTMHRILSRQ